MLGAYERGERALSLPRLDRLAQFYRVPVDQLLPRRATIRAAPKARAPRPKLAIDILKLTQLSGAPFEMLTRFLRMIQVQRQDFNGRVLTIRQDDKRAIAAMLDIPVDQVALRLEALDLVFRSTGLIHAGRYSCGDAMSAAVRGLRPHPVLPRQVRLLRVRHVDRPPPSDRRLPRRR